MDAALVAACEAGDEDAVAQLLAAGAWTRTRTGPDPCSRRAARGTSESWSGCWRRARARVRKQYACHGGHLDVIVRLQQDGADVRGRMKDMLRSAVQHGHTHVLEHLLALGMATPADLDGAVVEALEHNRLDMCDLLLAAGANVHSLLSTYRGDALAVAARTGEAALVERLLERGVNAPAPERQASLDRAQVGELSRTRRSHQNAGHGGC